MPINIMFDRAGRIKSLIPATEVPETGYVEPFDLDWLVAPVLTGAPLRVMTAVMESPLAGPIRRPLLRNNKLPQILEELFMPERPTFQPNTEGWPAESGAGLAPLSTQAEQELMPAGRASAAAALLAAIATAYPAQATNSTAEASGGAVSSSTGRDRRHYTAADFHRAYASGEATPSDVAERLIAAVAASEAQSPPMRFFVAHEPDRLRQLAAASTQRWAEGRPLSPLDGVPFAVKDCVDALPYPTTAGTAFMANWRTPRESLVGVQSLVDAGALLVGKATLHEIGLGTTGLNLVTGTTRNPHSTSHHTGGSSSGSAALVAAGLCPFAVGTDGGGSIRIPAAACGVVGLKPTHDRLGTEVGVPPIDQSVAVCGPIAGSVPDCALMYAVMANTGRPAGTPPLPPVMLPAGLGGDLPLAGKTAGICWEWFDQAAPAVSSACRAAVGLLQVAGLQVVDINVPELALLRAAHACTIVSEMCNNMQAALQDGGTRRQMNTETRVALALGGGGFTAAHYIQAQKIRTRVEAHFRRAFASCDFIITPTLPCTAPPINPAALYCGQSDVATTTALMHYVLAANMIGLPALTVPVGAVPCTNGAAGAISARTPKASASASASAGGGGGLLLPVGLQLMGPCWHEGSLLHAGAVLEAAVAASRAPLQLPPVWYDVLAGEGGSGAQLPSMKAAIVDGRLQHTEI